MNNPENIKKIVKDKYGSIARAAEAGCGCGCGCPGEAEGTWAIDAGYEGTEGYVPAADLSLGCGLPVKHAGIRPGHTVVDLGAGAGNDVFIARRIVGESGRVIGIDMTPEMIDQAMKNNAKLGFANVEFKLGDIEDLPVGADTTDVVVSNCVLNLVPDKAKAFAEISRILKPGGHFCVSDIVLKGKMPEKFRSVAEMYTGCVAGAQQEDEYLKTIRDAGFVAIEVNESRLIELPDEALKPFLDESEIALIRTSGFKVLSITVTGTKPLL